MSAAVRAIFAPKSEGPWLFGKRTDLWVFGGSALAAVALLFVGAAFGLLEGSAPGWAWIVCVLAIDVAHVWSTMFRVYLDGAEVRRRPLLYLGTPLLCWGLGVLAYAFSPLTFWRVLAYAAVFHFVRQQWGWVALYRRRAGEQGRLDLHLDRAATYAATIYPLIWWHAHLPRGFVWFLQDDFVVGLAEPVAALLAPVYWGVMIAFVGRQLWRWRDGTLNAGKALVVFTTWLCWWLGIMVFDGDFAFTVTNVIIHGVPYLALTYRYGRARAAQRPTSLLARVLRGGVWAFLAFIVIVAFAEETLWDRLVWHDRPWLFGEGVDSSDALLLFLVPLLAVPQATHYALDGFIWKVRRGNPELAAELRAGSR
ncbi:MAG: hypothetical protein EVA89_33910 [Sandaracinaceae bacterium]|nr:MAG: hypothetical protein EVA89_33910 [Sandaracinaceae bacterium]